MFLSFRFHLLKLFMSLFVSHIFVYLTYWNEELIHIFDSYLENMDYYGFFILYCINCLQYSSPLSLPFCTFRSFRLVQFVLLFIFTICFHSNQLPWSLSLFYADYHIDTWCLRSNPQWREALRPYSTSSPHREISWKGRSFPVSSKLILSFPSPL